MICTFDVTSEISIFFFVVNFTTFDNFFQKCFENACDGTQENFCIHFMILQCSHTINYLYLISNLQAHVDNTWSIHLLDKC